VRVVEGEQVGCGWFVERGGSEAIVHNVLRSMLAASASLTWVMGSRTSGLSISAHRHS
jgi:hypothetical protein